LNFNEGRVASSMRFNSSVYAGHLRSHNIIVDCESLRAFGSMEAIRTVESRGVLTRVYRKLPTQTRLNLRNGIIRN
jgi:hypothetical protein